MTELEFHASAWQEVGGGALEAMACQEWEQEDGAIHKETKALGQYLGGFYGFEAFEASKNRRLAKVLGCSSPFVEVEKGQFFFSKFECRLRPFRGDLLQRMLLLGESWHCMLYRVPSSIYCVILCVLKGQHAPWGESSIVQYCSAFFPSRGIRKDN